jgi:hypothetical protein
VTSRLIGFQYWGVGSDSAGLKGADGRSAVDTEAIAVADADADCEGSAGA